MAAPPPSTRRPPLRPAAAVLGSGGRSGEGAMKLAPVAPPPIPAAADKLAGVPAS